MLESVRMNNEQKIIKNKVGLLKLAETLGNVSDACKVMGYTAGTAFIGSKNCPRRAAKRRYRKSVARNLS